MLLVNTRVHTPLLSHFSFALHLLSHRKVHPELHVGKPWKHFWISFFQYRNWPLSKLQCHLQLQKFWVFKSNICMKWSKWQQRQYFTFQAPLTVKPYWKSTHVKLTSTPCNINHVRHKINRIKYWDRNAWVLSPSSETFLISSFKSEKGEMLNGRGWNSAFLAPLQHPEAVYKGLSLTHSHTNEGIIVNHLGV